MKNNNVNWPLVERMFLLFYLLFNFAISMVIWSRNQGVAMSPRSEHAHAATPLSIFKPILLSQPVKSARFLNSYHSRTRADLQPVFKHNGGSRHH